MQNSKLMKCSEILAPLVNERTKIISIRLSEKSSFESKINREIDLKKIIAEYKDKKLVIGYETFVFQDANFSNTLKNYVQVLLWFVLQPKVHAAAKD